MVQRRAPEAKPVFRRRKTSKRGAPPRSPPGAKPLDLNKLVPRATALGGVQGRSPWPCRPTELARRGAEAIDANARDARQRILLRRRRHEAGAGNHFVGADI